MSETPMTDTELERLLKQSDPAVTPSPLFLSALEASILAGTHEPRIPPAPGFPVWMLARGASSRVAFAAIAFALLSGFAVGRLAIAPAADPVVAGVPALMALADQNQDATDTTDTEGEDDVQ